MVSTRAAISPYASHAWGPLPSSLVLGRIQFLAVQLRPQLLEAAGHSLSPGRSTTCQFGYSRPTGEISMLQIALTSKKGPVPVRTYLIRSGPLGIISSNQQIWDFNCICKTLSSLSYNVTNHRGEINYIHSLLTHQGRLHTMHVTVTMGILGTLSDSAYHSEKFQHTSVSN